MFPPTGRIRRAMWRHPHVCALLKVRNLLLVAALFVADAFYLATNQVVHTLGYNPLTGLFRGVASTLLTLLAIYLVVGLPIALYRAAVECYIWVRAIQLMRLDPSVVPNNSRTNAEFTKWLAERTNAEGLYLVLARVSGNKPVTPREERELTMAFLYWLRGTKSNFQRYAKAFGSDVRNFKQNNS